MRLVDYLILSTLHSLTKKSVYALHQVVREENANAPSAKDIDSMRIDFPLILHPEELEADSQEAAAATDEPTTANEGTGTEKNNNQNTTDGVRLLGFGDG